MTKPAETALEAAKDAVTEAIAPLTTAEQRAVLEALGDDLDERLEELDDDEPPA